MDEPMTGAGGAPGGGPGAFPRTRLGDFALLEELGRGGMGVVFRAQQESMGRIVALKILPSFVSMDADAVARFRREAEAAGRLSHPGIVPIYAVGEDDGIHYYAMELVEGPSLDHLVRSLAGRAPERLLGSLAEETALDEACPGIERSGPIGAASLSGSRYARSCAEIGVGVAAALAAAHAGRVIHRDLKPSNILIHRSGRPVLVDFGLARDELAQGLTRSGDALGTPSYMSPEQVSGRSDLDGRVDVYGLGATLYEMLTLRPPFDGPSVGEIMRRILEEDPTPIRQINPRVPPDLEKIVHTCLAKDPFDRYPAAESLELDLRAFLAGQPVFARRPHLGLRILRSVQRNRRAAGVGLMVLLACVAAVAVAAVVGRQRSFERGREALDAALAHLVAGNLDDAQLSYGRAAELLPSEDVAAARLDHLPRAFSARYEAGDYAALRAYLDSWSVDARDDVWAAWNARLEGRGTFRFAAGIGEADAVELTARRVEAESGELGMPEPIQPGARLPLGEYLLSIEVPGHAVTRQRVVIERDGDTELAPRLVSIDDVPAGMVLVPLDDGHSVFVRRTEATVGAYVRTLEEIVDPAVGAELRPRDWDSDTRDDAPVRGLTFAQARLFAALRGGHLLDAAEFRAAASAGLDRHAYPWGPTFDADRVVADRRQLSAPRPVGSLPLGASPHGVLDLAGNVAEILSPGLFGEPVMAGGDYHSSPDELRIDASKRLSDGLDDRAGLLKYSGVRLARFVQPSVDAGAERRLEERVAAVRQANEPGVFTDWTVLDDGSVQRSMLLAGVHSQDREIMDLEVATPGFLQLGELVVADGFGARLVTKRDVSPTGESSLVRIALPRKFARGEGYRLTLSNALAPRGALVQRNDCYELRVPLKRTIGLRHLARLRLPDRCRVDAVTPTPDHFVTAEDGATILAWDLPPSTTRGAIVPVRVVFRRDGLMTAVWPATGGVRAAVDAFLAAWRERDAVALEKLMHPAFRQLPQDRLRRDIVQALVDETGTAATSAPLADDRYDDVDVLDVTVVEDTATAWLRVDWWFRSRERDPREVRLPNWPLRMQLRRARRSDGDRWTVLELAPAAAADGGRLEPAGYAHDGLAVRILPPDPTAVSVFRAEDELTDMQVRFAPHDLPGVRVTALGVEAPREIEDAMVLHLLTRGDALARPGERVPGDELAFLGPAGGGVALGQRPRAAVSHWLFGRPGGTKWARESWSWVRQGSRHVLLRCTAEGVTAAEAERRFGAATAFFQAMHAAVHID